MEPPPKPPPEDTKLRLLKDVIVEEQRREPFSWKEKECGSLTRLIDFYMFVG